MKCHSQTDTGETAPSPITAANSAGTVPDADTGAGADTSRDTDAKPDAKLMAGFVARVVAGEVRAGARLMRLVDDRHPLAAPLLTRLHRHTGRARIIGITGNPGSGKSTLTDKLIRHYRGQGLRVAVVAVDPTSPFSGGAILGDRIRMNDHATDPGVFIRSVATRGHMGGLSRSTNDIVGVLDAMGYHIILLETVGVGQDEVEIVRLAHTSVVVTVPGLGDEMQAIKAGLLEIADIFVVNKADRDGVDRTIRDIRMLQMLGPKDLPWTPPIVRMIATAGEGIDALAAAAEDHWAYLKQGDDGLARDRRRARFVLETLVRDTLVSRFEAALYETEGGPDALYDRLNAREADPHTEAARLVARIIHGQG